MIVTEKDIKRVAELEKKYYEQKKIISELRLKLDCMRKFDNIDEKQILDSYKED